MSKMIAVIQGRHKILKIQISTGLDTRPLGLEYYFKGYLLFGFFLIKDDHSSLNSPEWVAGILKSIPADEAELLTCCGNGTASPSVLPSE